MVLSKPDMEKVGLFQEMGYLHGRGENAKLELFNNGAHKGKQLLAGCHKTSSALQSGYFDSKFHRVMVGESYVDKTQLKKKQREQNAERNVSNFPFIPSEAGKKQCGFGSHFGTFGGPVPAFSPAERALGKRACDSKPNFHVAPGKKGSGYGYPDVTIGALPSYSPDPYDRAKKLYSEECKTDKEKMKSGPFHSGCHSKSFFDKNPFHQVTQPTPAEDAKDATPKTGKRSVFMPSSPSKKMAGCKAGAFNKYPSHSIDPYTVKGMQKQINVFYPQACPKSTRCVSILGYNINIRMNQTNYKTIRSVMFSA